MDECDNTNKAKSIATLWKNYIITGITEEFVVVRIWAQNGCLYDLEASSRNNANAATGAVVNQPGMKFHMELLPGEEANHSKLVDFFRKLMTTKLEGKAVKTDEHFAVIITKDTGSRSIKFYARPWVSLLEETQLSTLTDTGPRVCGGLCIEDGGGGGTTFALVGHKDKDDNDTFTSYKDAPVSDELRDQMQRLFLGEKEAGIAGIGCKDQLPLIITIGILVVLLIGVCVAFLYKCSSVKDAT